jgi:hypothetical protein
MGGGSSAPTLPAETAAPPTLEDSSVKTARDNELRANLLRRGRASTIVAGNTALGEAQVTKKVLLGS